MTPERSPSRLHVALEWVSLVAVPLCAWAFVAWIDAATLAVDLPALRDGKFLPGSSAGLPAKEGAWTVRQIPDDWKVSRPGAIDGWYFFLFRANSAEPEPWGVYFPTIRMNVAVYVNGHLVGDGGRFEDPVARHWSRPLFFPFSPKLLLPGENLLHVQLEADHADRGYLGPIYVGPAQALHASFARRHFFRVVTVEAIAVAQVLLVVFNLLLWLQRPQDSIYGWFALACAVWALSWLNLLVVEIPVTTAAWEWLWYSSIAGTALLLSRCAIAFVDGRAPRLDRLLVVHAVLGSAAIGVLAFAGSPWFETVATRGWLTLALPVVLYARSRVSAALRREPRNVEFFVLDVTGLLVIGCGMRDWLTLAGFLGPVDGLFSPYTAPPIAFGIGWILLRRFVGAMRRSEALATDLDRRITETHEELARSHEQMREIERQRVLSTERERIMRDMHDGIGAHLVSTLAMLERPGATPADTGGALRAALDDLRTLIDSLAPSDGDLLPALAMVRSRLQPRLEAAGIRVEWRVEAVPAISGLGPNRVLQVIRIVQEAIANVVKHAQARTLDLRIGEWRAGGRPPGVSIEIRDDGRGISPAASQGRGMDNMRRRAQEIGAAIAFHSSSEGTRVVLWIRANDHDEASHGPTGRR